MKNVEQGCDLTQNEAHSACAESTNKEYPLALGKKSQNHNSQGRSSLRLTITWHAGKYLVRKLRQGYVRKLHQWYILCPQPSSCVKREVGQGSYSWSYPPPRPPSSPSPPPVPNNPYGFCEHKAPRVKEDRQKKTSFVCSDGVCTENTLQLSSPHLLRARPDASQVIQASAVAVAAPASCVTSLQRYYFPLFVHSAPKSHKHHSLSNLGARQKHKCGVWETARTVFKTED